MINVGDKFTVQDLRQSVQEVCRYNIRDYINNSCKSMGVIVGSCALYPAKITSDEYAAICIRQYSAVPSSAINLDQQLQRMGFKTMHRFSYNYNIGALTSHQIIYDAYCLDRFLQIYNTVTPRSKYESKYYAVLDDAFRISYYYAQYLWAYNPWACANIANCLQMPNVSQWAQIISSILGIGFQFHPDDIYEYSIKHISPDLTNDQRMARYSDQLKFKKDMRANYGIDTGCLVLSPQSRDKLNKIVTNTDTPYYWQVIKHFILGHNR